MMDQVRVMKLLHPMMAARHQPTTAVGPQGVNNLHQTEEGKHPHHKRNLEKDQANPGLFIYSLTKIYKNFITIMLN
jgi:hypothetical protein